MTRFITLILLGLVVVLSVPITQQPAAAQTDLPPYYTLEHDGETRTYSVYIPNTLAPDESAPLIVALHPWASSGKAFEGMSGLDAVADELGAVIVYPNALSFSWDDGRSLYEDRIADAFPRDDAGFLLAMMDAVNDLHPIDRENVTFTGLGNGGAMAVHMACNYPNHVQRIIVTGTMLTTYQRDNCSPESAQRADILYVVGEHDAFAGPDGRSISPPTRDLEAISVLNLRQTLDFWQEHNGCDTINDYTRSEDGLAWSIFECEATLAVITLEEAGHHWLRVGDYALNQYGVDMPSLVKNFMTLSSEDFSETVAAIDYTTDVFGEWTRSYRAYVPNDYDPTQNYPVVVALHGRPDSGYGFAYIMDMNDTADAEDFIVVYPDGKLQGWHYTEGFEGFGVFTDQDDVTFLQLLLDDLALDYSIDRDRAYLMGFSNGGFMTVRMACQSPETFAGYAVIGGGMMELLLGEYCFVPVNLAIMHGTADPSIPIDGIEQDGIWVTWPTLTHVTFWADLNGCRPQEAVEERINTNDADDSYVAYFDFGDCETGNRLGFWMIVGGGHTIPGAPERLTTLGNYNQDIDTAQVLWDFWTAEE